jgi:hypothetical protein
MDGGLPQPPRVLTSLYLNLARYGWVSSGWNYPTHFHPPTWAGILHSMRKKLEDLVRHDRKLRWENSPNPILHHIHIDETTLWKKRSKD